MDGSDLNPLGVILVSKGTKADRLLFVYPYDTTDPGSAVCQSPYATPYSMREPAQFTSEVQRPSGDEGRDLECYFGFPTDIIAHLFTVRECICQKNFELKIDNVRYVGYPMKLDKRPEGSVRLDGGDPMTILMFNIVFVLQARSSKRVVLAYQNLAHRLSVAINSEETRCGYLTRQAEIMLRCQDEIAALSEADSAGQSPYRLMLRSSELCQLLKQTMQDVAQYGTVQIYINQWIEVSFCLTEKVLHRLKTPVVSADEIEKGLRYLRPFHGLLLCEEMCEIIDSLPIDASGCIEQLLRVVSPMISLQDMANEADLPLSQVLFITDHLVKQGKVKIIFPLCESNLYCISPFRSYSHALIDSFADCFSGANLLSILSEFSHPTTLKDFTDPLSHGAKHQQERVQMVVWFLRHYLITQLHTYFYLAPMKNDEGATSDVFSSTFLYLR